MIDWHYDEETRTLYFEGEGRLEHTPCTSDEDHEFRLCEWEGYEPIYGIWPWGDSDPRRIVIGHGITSVGALALLGMEDVESIHLSDTVRYVEPSAFSSLKRLMEFDVHPDNAYLSVRNGSLTDIEGTVLLAYARGTPQEHYDVPHGIVRLEDCSFRCCELRSITFPDTLVEIGECAFDNCSSLESVTIPNSVRRISEKAFGSSGVRSVEFGTGLERLERYAFQYCSELFDVVLPETLERNDDFAFHNCMDLKFIHLPSGLCSIGTGVFDGCHSLRGIRIPRDLTELGDGAFGECKDLERIDVEEGNTSFTIVDGVLYDGSMTRLVRVPPTYGSKTFHVPESVTSVDAYAFDHCHMLERISIHDGVTYIGCHAFNECRNLLMIELPKDLKRLEKGLFDHCLKLKDVSIPNGVGSIGMFAFYSCISLRTLRLPPSVSVLEDHAFYGCMNLMELCIEGSIETFPSGVFGYCAFTELPVCDGLRTIGDGAFEMCSKLKDVHIPEGVVSIDRYAFHKCEGITSLYLPDSLRTLIGFAFLNDVSLRKISLPSSMDLVDDDVFEGCSSIEEVIVRDREDDGSPNGRMRLSWNADSGWKTSPIGPE